MDIKFISSEGFGKIESLSKNRNTKKFNTELTTFQKAVRFSKRVLKEAVKDAKSVKNKIGDITWATLTPKKFFTGVRKFHISGSYFEFMRSPKGIVTALAPVAAAVLLVFTVCFWTLSDKPLTVSIDGEYIGTIENEAVLTQASASFSKALSDASTEMSATPVMQLSYPTLTAVEKSDASQVYKKLVDHSDAVVGNAGGLYVDGVFYGATEDSNALQAALISVLDEAKARYDETTTTTFENNVQVITDVYATESLKSVEQIIEDARSSFSIRLETDLTVEYEQAYSTEYEYDSTQLDTYCEVKTSGENGLQKVNYRLVYIDGVQTDAKVISTTTVKEPVTQVLVVGTQESFVGSGNFTWPVPYTYNITSPFEHRWGTFHYGLDISWSGIYGADIVASDAGTVVWAGWDSSGYGNYVIIDHGNGYETLYAHCCAVYVSIGDKVHQGDVIAGVGSTGYSTGNHLHFEIIKNGVKVDPELYVKGKTYIDG